MGTFGKKSILSIAAAALMGTVFATSAQAEDSNSTDLYINLFGGGLFQFDADYRGTINPPGGNQTVAVDFNEGFMVGTAVGLKFNNYKLGPLTPRLEAEVSFRTNDVDTVDFSGNGAGQENCPCGDVSSIFIMGNALFDVTGLQSDVFTPYFGGGIGVALVNNGIRYNGNVRLPDGDENFAVQAIVGGNFKINDLVSLNVDGRYYRAFDVTSNRFLNNNVNTGRPDTDLDGFAVSGGFTVKLGSLN